MGIFGRIFKGAGKTGAKVGAGIGLKELLEILMGISAQNTVKLTNELFKVENIDLKSNEDLIKEIEAMLIDFKQAKSVTINEQEIILSEISSNKTHSSD